MTTQPARGRPLSSEALGWYDSQEPSHRLANRFREVSNYRKLFQLLVIRDLSVRHKRSLLGVYWTLLNPLLSIAVLWLVFSNVFRYSTGSAPYILYLVSGVILMTFFQRAVLEAGSAVVDNAEILGKVYVPAEVFCLSAATAAAASFVISLVPALILQVVLHIKISWTVALVPLLAVALLSFSAGCGLVVAAGAARFYDAIDLTRVGLYALTLLSPTFYPIDIVSPRVRLVLEFNPMYHFLVLFRFLLYQGTSPPLTSVAVVVGASALAFATGTWVFARNWRRVVVTL